VPSLGWVRHPAWPTYPLASKVAVVHGLLPHAAIVKLGRQYQAVPKPSR
jgi:hypothetical protein